MSGLLGCSRSNSTRRSFKTWIKRVISSSSRFMAYVRSAMMTFCRSVEQSQLGSDHTVQAVLPQLSEQRVDIKVFRDLDFGA